MARDAMGALYYCIIFPVVLVLGSLDFLARYVGLKNNPVSRWIDQEEMYNEVSQTGD